MRAGGRRGAIGRTARGRVVVLAGAFALAWTGCGSSGSAQPHELRVAAEAVVAAGAPGSLVLAWRPPERPFAVAAGSATLAPRSPMRPDTPQHVGSVTKTFTAVLVLQLVDQGLLALDETIARYLPEGLLVHADRITVRQLLQHTSGLRDYFAVDADDGGGVVWEPLRSDPAFVYAPEELVALGAAGGLESAPGERYAYSNTGYILLGMILEAVTGTPVAELYAERIFAPLGLRRTVFPVAPGDTLPGQAHCHSRFLDPGAAGLVDLNALDPSFAWVAGAIISTTADVARFLDALLLRGALLSAEALAEMRSSLVATGQEDTFYGLGIIRTGSGAGQLWWHNGSWPGCTATAGVLTEQGVTVVQMQNTGLADQSDELTAAIGAELVIAIRAAGGSL